MLLFWTTYRLPSLLLSLLLAAAFHNTAVHASKDDSYYAANSGNPNTMLKMYWKDAENVLQDLSKFGSLYVQFHSCVWSWMHPTQSGYNDEDIDENDYWYMGSVPPMGPNVAYSLYGSLKGHAFEGCSADTFINSFYTDAGFEDFAAAMYAAGVSGFSAYANGNGGGDDDNSYSSSSSSSSYSSSCYGGYGVGCDSTNGFALHKYASDECDPKYATAVADTLSSLNSAMNQATCVKIFDGSSYSSSSGSSSYSSSSSSSSALALLQYSTACNYMNYWSPDGECPDPYNKIAYYINNFSTGIKHQHPDPYQWYYADVAAGRSMMRKGLVFFGLAAVVVALGWTSHLWMPKWPAIQLPKWPTQRKQKPPVKKIDLAVPSGIEESCVLPSRSWFLFGGGSTVTASGNTNDKDDPHAVKSFDTAASQQQYQNAKSDHKKKKSKKRKRKNTATSDAASVKSADSAYQLQEDDVLASPTTGTIDEDESVPASTSWFSFGSSSPATKKDKKTPQDAPGDVVTSKSWFSVAASGKKDAAPSLTATKKKETATPAVMQEHVRKNETGVAAYEKETAPAVKKEAAATTLKEEDQDKGDVPAATSWFSFTSTTEKEEGLSGCQSGLMELLDPQPDPTWRDVQGDDQPRTKYDGKDEQNKTDNNDEAVPSASSWFSFTSSGKKKKVEEAPKEDNDNKTKIDQEPNHSAQPPEDSAVPAATSWFSFLSTSKKDDNDKADAADDNANGYVLHEEVEAAPSPQEEKDTAAAYISMDKMDARADVPSRQDETPADQELVDDSHYALLTAVSSLTCDQTTVTHLDEDAAPKAVVEEKAAPEYTPLHEALNAVPESAAETTSTPSQEGSDSMPDTKVMDNVNVTKQEMKEDANDSQESLDSVPETKVMDNMKAADKKSSPSVSEEHSTREPKDAGTSICHEDAKVEAVLSGDGSDIQSVTPSELVTALSRQQEVAKEGSEGDSHNSMTEKAEEVLSDLRSVGTAHSLTPEEMAARVMAARSRQDDESTIGGAFSDVRSVGTAHSLTPEEMAARILKKRVAKEEGEGA